MLYVQPPVGALEGKAAIVTGAAGVASAAMRRSPWRPKAPPLW